MKFTKTSDTLVTVCLPLLLGLAIYFSERIVYLPQVIVNFLPDGLWAYALISAILIIWDRKFNITWIILVFLNAVCFEELQHLHFVRGTGDINDVVTYFFFFGIALFQNKFFKNLYFKQPQTTLV